jgi:hypothetical protein
MVMELGITPEQCMEQANGGEANSLHPRVRARTDGALLAHPCRICALSDRGDVSDLSRALSDRAASRRRQPPVIASNSPRA